MSKLRLSLACWDYDRTRGLLEGHTSVDGIELTCLNLPVEETFFRMLRFREFDVAEMSLSSYVRTLFSPAKPFVAIPIFPSRFFRHSCIYINTNSGIQNPQDLKGKRVGTPEYQMTAGVWIRGILSDDFGVGVSSPAYFCGGEEQTGRREKLALSLPPQIRLQPIAPTKTLSAMLDAGEIDALYTARMPSTFAQGSANVKRLFEDYQAVECEYYKRTKIFPIMHTVVIRRDVYEEHPWVAQSLYKAFAKAQQEVYQDLYQTAALKYMLPWLIRHVEDTRSIMGEDFWSYGFAANLHTLTTFLRYSYEQGISERHLTPQELFVSECSESFRI